MHIQGQRLTVEPRGDMARIVVTYTVILQEPDLDMNGGFLESVWLSPAPSTSFLSDVQRSLPVFDAVKPSAAASWRELPRQHTFYAPLHPAGPFTTVRFTGHVKVRPAAPVDDLEITNEGVLPAKFTVSSVVRLVGRRLADLFG